MRRGMNNDDKNLRHNFTVNILDGGFFGLGLGFASLTAILPLFVSQMTDSAILIGLIPALRGMGWQLPQLLAANRVAQMKRFKPAVVFLTGGERLPYLGFAAVAWFLPSLNSQVALVLTFGLIIFAALSSGITASPWQSMIAKIIPGRRLSTFFGLQAAAANLMLSIGAIFAGIILVSVSAPSSFAFCFLITTAAMIVSWFWLAQAREEEHQPAVSASPDARAFWRNIVAILERDVNFRWFLVGRMFSQVAIVGFAFYTVYAVRHYGVGVGEASAMTAVFAVAQIVANVGMGWFGDRWGNRAAMQVGLVAATSRAWRTRQCGRLACR
jgi:MFS family permease